jgi:hypothetical protein
MTSHLVSSIYQPINVHGVNYIKQAEIPTAEPSVSEFGFSDTEIANEMLTIHRSQGTDQTLAEMIRARGKY